MTPTRGDMATTSTQIDSDRRHRVTLCSAEKPGDERVRRAIIPDPCPRATRSSIPVASRTLSIASRLALGRAWLKNVKLDTAPSLGGKTNTKLYRGVCRLFAANLQTNARHRDMSHISTPRHSTSFARLSVHRAVMYSLFSTVTLFVWKKYQD